MKVCELPETGTVKVGLTISSEGVIKYYYSNADGDMIAGPVYDMREEANYNYLMSKEYKDKHAKYLEYIADDNPDNDELYLPYANFANFLTMNSMDCSWTFGRKMAGATFDAGMVEMGGQMVPVKNENGYNFGAVQAYAEKTCSVILKSWKIYVGDVYK